MKRRDETPEPEAPPTDDSVLDLAEVRAARAFAQALDPGVARSAKGDADEAHDLARLAPGAQEALDGAHRAATGREVALDEAALERALARAEAGLVQERRPGEAEARRSRSGRRRAPTST